MRFVTGLIIGIIIGSLVFGGFVVYAARQYTMSREYLTDFSKESVPILNNILRDIWYAVDDLDDRTYDLENP